LGNENIISRKGKVVNVNGPGKQAKKRYNLMIYYKFYLKRIVAYLPPFKMHYND